MAIKQLKYALKTDRGVMTAFKKNVIVVGDTDYQEFQTPLDVKEYIKTRQIEVLKRDELQADEAKMVAFYAEHYAKLQEIAVPFTAGLALEANHKFPISYKSKLYQCIQGHKTQADWTPDIVPALFSLIQPPTPEGYPAWVQPTGAQDAYQMGDRVSFNGKNYESKINANVWSPTVYPAGWLVI